MWPSGWFLLALSVPLGVCGPPAPAPFDVCTSPATLSSSNYDPKSRINVSKVFSQVIYVNGQKNLKTVLIAATGDTIEPSAQNTGSGILCESKRHYLFPSLVHPNILSATLLTRTSVLTFTLNQTNSWFCDTVRPPSPLPAPSNDSTYCPLPAGRLAFSVLPPLLHDYNLT